MAGDLLKQPTQDILYEGQRPAKLTLSPKPTLQIRIRFRLKQAAHSMFESVPRQAGP